MLSWLINHVNLDNENTLSSSSNAVFEYLILGVPQAYKVHIISSKGINTVALRNTGNFPKDTESHGSVPHVCSSQMHACVVSPCCSQRCIIVLWLRTAYVKTEWFLFWIRWSKHILIYRLIFKKNWCQSWQIPYYFPSRLYRSTFPFYGSGQSKNFNLTTCQHIAIEIIYIASKHGFQIVISSFKVSRGPPSYLPIP